jgi:ubiquinone/menaquinone biosynthesis C-methylase UbiE
MQDSYERVSNLSSFGFNRRWRRQCVNLIALRPGMTVCDMMTGTGESWMYILPEIGETGTLFSIDFSPVMIRNADRRRKNLPAYSIHLLEEDALANSIAPGTMDAVISTYGVKTLDPQLWPEFVSEVARILKPDGSFALVEISVPPALILRWGYYGYLKFLIPIIGSLFLGNHENYRMLSQYLRAFKNCEGLGEEFRRQGFEVKSVPFFWGCATALTGRKLT